LRESACVAGDQERCVLVAEELNTSGVRRGSGGYERLRDDRGKIDVIVLDGQLSILDLRDEEKIVDEAEQAFGVSLDDPRVRPLLLRQVML